MNYIIRRCRYKSTPGVDKTGVDKRKGKERSGQMLNLKSNVCILAESV